MVVQIRKTEGRSTDSWHGVQDARTRKRIQDRLAQRARRKRLAEAAEEAEKSVVICHARLPDTADTELSRERDIVATDPCIIEGSSIGSSPPDCAQTWPRLFKPADASCSDPTKALFLLLPPHPGDASSSWSDSMSTSKTGCASTTTSATLAGSASAGSSSSLLPIIGTKNRGQFVNPYYSARENTPPLPSDWRYLNASKIDVIEALGVCGSFLGMVCGLDFDRSSRPACSIPPMLHPTPLQLITPHYRWIDRLPFPRLRDNLILLANTVKLEELFMDFFTIETFTIDEQRPPWDPKAWRPSTEFREKWGYLFH